MIIGISGRARSGKSTVADHMARKYGFMAFAFADPMKQMLSDIFQWEDRHMNGDLKEVVDERWGFSPRKAMQIFGTEFGRRLNPDLWLIFAADEIDAFGEENQNTVISDIRFDNEAGFVRKRGGLVLHLFRNAGDTINGEPGHSSEHGVEFVDGDAWILNDGSISDLLSKVDEMMTAIGIKG